jgi:ribosome-binding factor A
MSVRTNRVATLVKECIGEALTREVDSSGYGILTVTDVFVTADLRLAKVYISHYRSNKTNEEVMSFFDSHLKQLRMKVGRELSLKFTPELKFYIDETLERVQRLEEIFKQIHTEESNR